MEQQDIRLEGSALDIPGSDLTQEPRYPGTWWTNNYLVRALCHLFGFDGANARALRCSTGGVLHVHVYEIANSQVNILATAIGQAVRAELTANTLFVNINNYSDIGGAVNTALALSVTNGRLQVDDQHA